MKLVKKTIAIITVIATAIAVIGFMPGKAEAATGKPKINVSSKVIYVGGSSVRPAYGETYTYHIKNRPKKYSVTWSSSDENVAKIEKLEYSKAKVTAVSAGKATITADFIDKVSSTKYTLTTIVTVKKNAAAITISPATIPVLEKGQTYPLTAKLYNKDASEAAAGEITDTIRWISSDTDVATVDNSGQITARGAGKATLTCFTIQKTTGAYSKIEKATAKKTIEVEVNDPAVVGITKVTQLTTTDIAVEFGGNYSDNISKDNLTISRDGIIVMVRDIKFEDEGKKAILSTYQGFVDGVTYLVRYNNSLLTEGKETTFKATVGEPTRIELYTEVGANMAIAGKLTGIHVRLFNEANVDITPSDKTSQDYLTIRSRLNIKFAEDDYNVGYIDNSANKSICIYESGKTVTLIGEYSYAVYTGTSYVDKKITGVIPVNAVTEALTMTYEASMVTKQQKSGSQLDWSNPDSKLSVSDKEGYKIVSKVKKADGSYIYSTDTNSHIFFRTSSSSSSVNSCYVYENGTLLPLNTGSETVLIYYGDDITKASPIGQFTINVVEKRIPARMIFEQGKEQVSTIRMSDAYNVSKESVTVRIMDQYNSQIDIVGDGNSVYVSTVTVQPVEDNGPWATVKANSDGTALVEIDALGRGAASGSNYRIKVSYSDPAYGSLDGYLNTLVFKPNDNASSTYSVSVEGDTNMKITANALPELTLSLYEVKNGIKYQKIETVKASPSATGNAIYDGDYYYRLYKDGKEIARGVQNNLIKIVYNESGNNLVKYETGSYIIKVFRRQTISGQTVDPQVCAGGFVLTDTTGSIRWEVVSPTSTSPIKKGMDGESVKPVLGECIRFYIGNESVGTSQITFPDDPIVSDGEVFFRTVAIAQSITVGTTSYSIKHVLTINTRITNK
ncbi:MAG: Ig-like domain-containing protein [Lachnospiraceae bacterium]|nr:Ig-like domain-containing protein [Lachnospiraceae bacterium]